MRRPTYFGYPYSGHDSGSYDPGYPSSDYDYGSYDPDDPGYPSDDYDSCPGKLSIPDGRVKAAASMELSHLRGQRGRQGRCASSHEQRHWQRQTSSLRTGVSVAEAAKPSVPPLPQLVVNLPMPPPPPEEYTTTSRCREPSASRSPDAMSEASDSAVLERGF